MISTAKKVMNLIEVSDVKRMSDLEPVLETFMGDMILCDVLASENAAYMVYSDGSLFLNWLGENSTYGVASFERDQMSSLMNLFVTDSEITELAELSELKGSKKEAKDKVLTLMDKAITRYLNQPETYPRYLGEGEQS